MKLLDKEMKINLTDGSVLYGIKGEYIASVISSNADYYEINDLKRFSKYIPNDPIVYDIGSNIGNHTVYFHKYYRAKKIYAFEPVSINADLLEKTVSDNKLSNVEVFRMAVGKKAGKADLTINERNMGECKIVNNSEGSITIVSLDEMELDKPNFIKIDVEGAELEVLRGMTETLASACPVIWIEINDHFQDVDQFLKQYQYELIDKHNFNHIYIKCDRIHSQIEAMQIFKESIVQLYNKTLTEKWNLNNWFLSEKDKVKKLEHLIKELYQQIAELNSNLKGLEDKYNSSLNHYEKEKNELFNVITNLNFYLEEQRTKYNDACRRFESEKYDLHNKILNHIREERKVLNELRAIREHYQTMESRYLRMRNSMPGKIAVKLWKFLKRFK